MSYIEEFSKKNKLDISRYKAKTSIYWEHSCKNCNKIHLWKTSISERKRGSGCPYCSGRYTCECKSIFMTHPELVKEWHPDNTFPPKEISKGSNKKIKWKCINNHEWITTPNYRTGKSKTGCPYCKNRKLNNENNLAIVYPEIVKTWNFEKNDILPDNVFPSSPKKVWWICEKNHEWESTVNNRLRRGCAYCTKNRLLPDKSNSLFYTHEKLMNEWNYDKNIDISPKELTFGMSVKVWWKCNNGHEWESTVNNRTSGVGCPFCRESKGEKDIKEYLEKNCIEYKRQYFIKYGNFKKLFIDFYLPKYNIAIEYDGIQHFESVKHFGGEPKFNRQIMIDRAKEEFCKENSMNLIKIHYKDKDDMEFLISNALTVDFHFLYYSYSYFNK